jgi:excisionase family DNA binding protein
MVPGPRFLTPTDVAEELNVNLTQVRSLLRSGELRGIQIGGRGIWRIERAELERYIGQRYDEIEHVPEQVSGSDGAAGRSGPQAG